MALYRNVPKAAPVGGFFLWIIQISAASCQPPPPSEKAAATGGNKAGQTSAGNGAGDGHRTCLEISY
jgi:hypothetical protein